jgi:hypothetical protein
VGAGDTPSAVYQIDDSGFEIGFADTVSANAPLLDAELHFEGFPWETRDQIDMPS